MFKKFPSLENTYRQKEIDMVVNLGLSDQEYVVTEKVHGANFSFWLTEVVLPIEGVGLCSGVNIECAKRSGFIKEDEKFFDYKTVREKYRSKMEELFYHYKEHNKASSVVVYGELYGGNIQSGMSYKKEQDFIAFDVVVDGKPLNKTDATLDLIYFDIPVVPVLEICNSLEEALLFNESFTSILTDNDFNGDDSHKEAEGVVIEPVNPSYFPNGSRVYFKKKTKRFTEKSGKPNTKHKLVQTLNDSENGILDKFGTYLTTPRLDAVCSKIGEVSIKDIGKVTGLTVQDILTDMVKDEISFDVDNKTLKKHMQNNTMNFVRPYLLSK